MDLTSAEFQASSIALLRSAVGWQSAIARRLGVESRSVRRWLADGAPPAWVDARFAELTGKADIAPWPRDEWLIGDTLGADGKRREYVAHLQPPRFVARIVACGEDGMPTPDEEPADILTGVVYSSDDFVIAEVDWIDEVAPGEIVKWLEAAADAIDAME